MKKLEFSILVSLILSITICFMVSLIGECNTLSDNVLRLHIIANSDSQPDQNLKLLVRDEVLNLNLFENAKTKSEAMDLAKENISLIKSTAEKTLLENGVSSNVQVQLVEMFFPFKRYDEFSLPAGVYNAVRITLGDGDGKNWWCVMFPQICVGACVDKSAILSENELLEKSVQYEARFKILEIAQKLLNRKAERYEK